MLLRIFLLSLFLLSTPICAFFVFYLEDDRTLFYGTINSYAFSIAMILLYFRPFFDYEKTFAERLKEATYDWILWLSVFTEIAFQIPHNLLTPTLSQLKGTVFMWPFDTYGKLADSRWSDFDSSLEPEVWLINVNDASLGVLVLILFWMVSHTSNDKKRKNLHVWFVLCVVFRDATLFRETVEYLWNHHRLNYPYTCHDPEYRSHGIIILWLVNVLWLIAPLLTIYWAALSLKSSKIKLKSS